MHTGFTQCINTYGVKGLEQHIVKSGIFRYYFFHYTTYSLNFSCIFMYLLFHGWFTFLIVSSIKVETLIFLVLFIYISLAPRIKPST